jgi:hypothetical protein
VTREGGGKAEYTIVHGTRPGAVAREVSRLLGEGWEVAGGVSVAMQQIKGDRYFYFAQSLVRRPKSK